MRESCARIAFPPETRAANDIAVGMCADCKELIKENEKRNDGRQSDIHSDLAAQVFGIAANDITADQRAFAKRLNFGIAYGIKIKRVIILKRH